MSSIKQRASVGALLVAGFFALIALGGCAWKSFQPYEGVQQNWPTSPGGFVDRKCVVPVYYGPPPRPYDVIGYLDATTAPIRRAGAVSFAARAAKEEGADAIIVLDAGSEYAGTISTGTAYAESVSSGNVQGTTTLNPGGGSYRQAQFNGLYQGTTHTTTYGNVVSAPMFRGKASVLAIKFK